MTVITTKDPILEIQRGNITNQSIRTLQGVNPSLAAASNETDIAPFGDLTYLAVGLAETIEIVSDNANDTLLGTGARTLFIEGLDINMETTTETVDMNGLTNVTSLNSYNRINNITVITAGSTEFNEGNITAIFTTAGTIQDQILPLESVSGSAHFTNSSTIKSYVFQLSFTGIHLSGQPNSIVDFRGYARDTGIANPAWLLLFEREIDLSREGSLIFQPPFTELTEETDLRFTADVDGGTVSIRSAITIVEIIQ